MQQCSFRRSTNDLLGMTGYIRFLSEFFNHLDPQDLVRQESRTLWERQQDLHGETGG